MTDEPLGKVEELDLREIWPDETRDFTPWLSENLDLLGEKLGLDLTPVATEHPIGSFFADIVAEDDAIGLVIIENQLTQSDHGHLGQLWTYAASMDAKVLVWVAPSFRPEHREAVEWFNRLTPEDRSAYCVRISAIRIGASQPAPVFEVIEGPPASKRKANPKGARYRAFWQVLIDDARQRGIVQANDEVRPGTSASITLPSRSGVAGVNYYARFAASRGVTVHCVINPGEDARRKLIFDHLHADKTAIERASDGKWAWERNVKLPPVVRTYHDGSIDSSEAELAEIRDWMLETYACVSKAIDDSLATLQPELDAEEADSVSGAPSSELR